MGRTDQPKVSRFGGSPDPRSGQVHALDKFPLEGVHAADAAFVTAVETAVTPPLRACRDSATRAPVSVGSKLVDQIEW